jgi:polysaccharide biosynthesis transport protein
MTIENTSAASGRRGSFRPDSSSAALAPEHYLRLLWHRKWLVLGVFAVVSAGTFVFASRLPNVYTSETLILVDPQKVPETYVRPTVTGDIRNRLGTLSQQILSTTRLQTIIDKFNLFPEERKTMAREDVIGMMRANIFVSVVSDFGANGDLQAFRIKYSGAEPHNVAQVTNELASLFIEENLKAREQQATGTTEFLGNQLQETRKTLEEQEAKLKQFKLQHIGEMPEQQVATLQALGQLQAQLQSETDALNRAEQQKANLESLVAQSSVPIMDMDDYSAPRIEAPAAAPATRNAPGNKLTAMRAQLEALLSRYTPKHPEVVKLKHLIEQEEAKTRETAASAALPVPAPAPSSPPVPAPPTPKTMRPPIAIVNPVLRTQLQLLDEEIAKHRDERQRLAKQTAAYQAKLEAIPVREQEMTDMVRDYEMSKGHYARLLDNQLSAETATELEIRQKGERFSILDPAQPAERPSSPKRGLINGAGSLGGLALGLMLALCTEVLGLTISSAEQVQEISGFPMLEIIPIIETGADRRRRKKRLILALASGAVVTTAAVGAVFVLHFM